MFSFIIIYKKKNRTSTSPKSPIRYQKPLLGLKLATIPEKWTKQRKTIFLNELPSSDSANKKVDKYAVVNLIWVSKNLF